MTEKEKKDDNIICSKCGNDTFKVYITDAMRPYCTKCGKDYYEE